MHRARASARWRHSLYARAALFIVLGSGTLLGAFAVLSSVAVDESVDRLLGERIDLARAAGEFVEHQLRTDLGRLGDHARRAIDPVTGHIDAERATDQLSREYRDTVFGDGVFLLDRDGIPVLAVPDRALAAVDVIDRAELVARARHRRGIVSSPLAELGTKSVLVLLTAIRAPDGTPLGYIGALLQPAATNVLGPLAHTDGRKQSRLALVDRGGVVVASTDERTVFRPGDHDAVLATAIRDRRDVRGRCHSCHDRSQTGAAPSTDVLAFAPLPTLDLGVAVQQREREALAPAFALRTRLLLLGVSFVSIFVIFAWLSVRSVVLPIKRLTRAVRRAEAGREPLDVDRVGKDELGELAVAIEMWRSRVVDSRERAERLREARLRESVRRGQQQQFLRRVLKAQEDERLRIARELHDTLAQDLAAYRLELERLLRHLTVPAIRQRVETLEERAELMLTTVRQILLDLRLSVLDSMGFVPALQWHLERLQRDQDIRATLVVDGEESAAIDYDTSVTLFRILQESLLNVVQHAEAHHVFVTVSFSPTSIELVVEDDGIGFDLDSLDGNGREHGRGLGILGMEERASLLGGEMTVSSAPGEGTTVRVAVPLEPAARAAAAGATA